MARKIKKVYYGDVIDGKLVIDYIRTLYRDIKDYFQDKRVKITIEEYVEDCSQKQWNLMWLWFSAMSESTGSDKHDFYDHYKRFDFLRRVKKNKLTNEPFVDYKKVTDLNVKEMSEFMNIIQADAAVNFNINLPIPEDLKRPDGTIMAL